MTNKQNNQDAAQTALAAKVRARIDAGIPIQAHDCHGKLTGRMNRCPVCEKITPKMSLFCSTKCGEKAMAAIKAN